LTCRPSFEVWRKASMTCNCCILYVCKSRIIWLLSGSTVSYSSSKAHCVNTMLFYTRDEHLWILVSEDGAGSGDNSLKELRDKCTNNKPVDGIVFDISNHCRIQFKTTKRYHHTNNMFCVCVCVCVWHWGLNSTYILSHSTSPFLW
jgi:hypothetical protein